MARDSRERFSTAAAFYAEHRPQYPEALLDWLAANTRVPARARIADVGCGTGIASRQLAGRGYEVVGIEPNEAMLAIARQAGGATFVRGEATSTGLPDHSVDLVVAAQAFHYFDLEPTLVEWRRIAKQGRCCSTFWYRLSPGPFKQDFHALRLRHAGDAEAETEAGSRLEKRRIIESLRRHPALCDVVDTKLQFEQALDLGELRGRVLASSHIAPDRDEAALDREIAALFALYEEGHRVRVPHDVFAVCWRFREG